jgi:hypothetical protein
LLKELVEIGIQTITTHYCINCLENPMLLWRKVQYAPDEDQAFMCLCCSIAHKRKHPDHYLQNLFQPAELASILKKEGTYRDQVKSELSLLISAKSSQELN